MGGISKLIGEDYISRNEGKYAGALNTSYSRCASANPSIPSVRFAPLGNAVTIIMIMANKLPTMHISSPHLPIQVIKTGIIQFVNLYKRKVVMSRFNSLAGPPFNRIILGDFVCLVLLPYGHIWIGNTKLPPPVKA